MPSDAPHRASYRPDPADIQLRESDSVDDEDIDLDDVAAAEDGEGVFVVRMPIASTGDVRNEGDDPLTTEELEGMAEQVDDRSPGVFLDHGTNQEVAGSRYSALGKIGEWANAALVDGERDGETLLEADARLMDPETLPAATGDLREALAVIKSQVDRALSIAASIGWSEDRSAPGGVDLLEASIVGIAADPRTTTDSGAPETARSLESGSDPSGAQYCELRDKYGLRVSPVTSAGNPPLTEAVRRPRPTGRSETADSAPADARRVRMRALENHLRGEGGSG